MFEPNTHRMARCEQCGARFMDDCGDAFCSSSCEREYERENETHYCSDCGEEFSWGELHGTGKCGECEHKDD